MTRSRTARPAPGDTSAIAAALPLDALTLGHGHAVDAWMRLNSAVLESVGRLQQEASRFVVRRLEDDLARQRQALTCRSPQDLWALYADFARQAVQDYGDEAGRLSQIAAEAQYACAGYGELIAADAAGPRPPES